MRKAIAGYITGLSMLCLPFLPVTNLHAELYIPQNSNRVNINLDTGWLYSAKDNTLYASTTGSEAGFTSVCVPHANVISKHAYLDTAAFRIVSWYRKHFTPPSHYNGRRVLVEFQAVATVAKVYVNDSLFITHKGAYTPFTIDITSKVKFGQDNIIAVQVDSKQHTEIPPEKSPSMDFMIFGGIVRHVNLIYTDPLYVNWTFVSTKNPSQTVPVNPVVFSKSRIVNTTAILKTCSIITTITNANNDIVSTGTTSQTVPANGNAEITDTTSAIANPKLWDVDNPNLYNVYVQIKDGDKFVDEYQTRMGIRSLTMSSTDGKCYLNGKALKLRGLNRHETYPYFGRAASKRLQRKDADILKYELGCNIVRTSHYPQSPDFLDRCDEVGLLVLEEIPGWNAVGDAAWLAIEMQTLVDMVKRDRNHPSLFTWGCRVNESNDYPWYKSSNDSARFYDPSRLTCGVRNSNGDSLAYFFEDIWTRNFKKPSGVPSPMPFITTEYGGHTIIPQAHVTDDDNILINQITNSPNGHGDGQNANYASPSWGGLLGWCAFDYNSVHPNATTNDTPKTQRGYNSYVSAHGVASIFRLPKLAGYFYRSQRDPTIYGPMVYICNYWTPSSPTTILVVSNCDQVDLLLNNVSISGKKTGNLYTSLPHPLFTWTVPSYQAGELKAIGYINGTQVATHGVKTPGTPTTLSVVPDTNVINDGGDMTRVVVSILDDYGQILHMNGDSVSLSATGSGDFIGESRTALEGGQIAYYVKTRAKSFGSITCNASVGTLSKSATITVVAPVSVQRPAVNYTQHANIQKTILTKVTGNRYSIPSGITKGSVISVYDIAGKLLLTKMIESNVIDFKKSGVSQGVHIVKIRSVIKSSDLIR